MLTKGGRPEFPHESLRVYNELKNRTCSEIAHGNIVALHSPAHNRFIRLCHDNNINGHGGQKDSDKLPVEWESEKFLVVQVAESTFAFYSVPHGQYICMNKDHKVSGRTLTELEDASNDQHHFLVRNEGWGRISLLSVPQGSFVRMDQNGNISGNAKVAREWEQYQVVLLMENPQFTREAEFTLVACP